MYVYIEIYIYIKKFRVIVFESMKNLFRATFYYGLLDIFNDLHFSIM